MQYVYWLNFLVLYEIFDKIHDCCFFAVFYRYINTLYDNCCHKNLEDNGIYLFSKYILVIRQPHPFMIRYRISRTLCFYLYILRYTHTLTDILRCNIAGKLCFFQSSNLPSSNEWATDDNSPWSLRRFRKNRMPKTYICGK